MRVFGYEFARVKPEPTRFLGDLTKINVSDGDVCVLMMPDRAGDELAARLRVEWQAIFGQQVTLLVLDNGGRIGVLSPQQAARATAVIDDAKAVQAALEAKA
jgi:hypothetical protein